MTPHSMLLDAIVSHFFSLVSHIFFHYARESHYLCLYGFIVFYSRGAPPAAPLHSQHSYTGK